ITNIGQEAPGRQLQPGRQTQRLDIGFLELQLRVAVVTVQRRRRLAEKQAIEYTADRQFGMAESKAFFALIERQFVGFVRTVKRQVDPLLEIQTMARGVIMAVIVAMFVLVLMVVAVLMGMSVVVGMIM